MRALQLWHPLFLFYALVIYVFASAIWWTSLHLKNNETIFQNQLVILEMKHHQNPPLNNATIKETSVYQDLLQKKQRKNKMILGESLVFLFIMALGSYQVHQGLRKEMQLSKQQHNFLLSITHELKSPLAAIKLAIETLQNRPLPEEKKARMYHNALGDVERLKVLVDNLLLAAHLENDTAFFTSENQNLSDITADIAYNFCEKYEHLRHFDISISEDIYYTCDLNAYASILSNLIENAIKYSLKEDKIGISLKMNEHNNTICLAISDTGLGIPDKEKAKVFQKFYRIGSENTRSTKGTGLGLFIVYQLVQKLQAQIRISDNTPKGSVFSIFFPK
ncbi:MAG: HAMP domain-containing sensor histidine kinase [Chitinophagales bacterium]|nr:HAMP domain-containing histidine kinase [Bacteroidota bacterium]MCB9042832.1 HAMP domain-containing histidine kinase [Chitinophagales bacterium]